MRMVHEKEMDKETNMITNYQVEMLNVADADAFIVYYLTKDGRKHLVLIDAGRYGNGENVLTHLNNYYAGIPIELAIITHPDDDHYGGFIYLLEQIQSNAKNAVPIQGFWLNNPTKHIKVEDVEEDIQRKTLVKRLSQIYSVGDKNLLTLLKDMKIPCVEAFATTYNKLYRLPNGNVFTRKEASTSMQEGFIILGPTEEYYQEVCKSFRFNQLHVKEIAEQEDAEDEANFVSSDVCYSKTLDDAVDDGNDHNMSSLIILFKPNDDERILFTGDACVASFEHMLSPHVALCNHVTWFKVPHHGSKANLNSKWIKHFRPNLSYISTLRRGKFLSQCTINALKNAGSDVVSMHNNQHLDAIVYHMFQTRPGWSSTVVNHS